MGLMEKFADPTVMQSLSMWDKLKGAGITTLMGMGITFCVLVLLWGCIALMTKIMHRSPKPQSAGQAPAEAPLQASVSEPSGGKQEEIAAITAAIAAYQGGNAKNLVIRKINRLPGQATAWTDAGRAECIERRKF